MLEDSRVAPTALWVYALTSNGPHHAEIVEFDGDGSLKSEIPLSPELPLVPSTVLALKQGFFVAGIMKANSSTEKARSFAAIYDQQGALVREIELKDDISPSSPSTASAITFKSGSCGR